MLYRLVRPVKRSGSSFPQFVQRIPTDVRRHAIGRTITFALGSETTAVTITPTMGAIRFSLRTRDPGEAKIRQAQAAAKLETVWTALRSAQPVTLSHREATALGGEVYRAWASERGERNISVTMSPYSGRFERDYLEDPEEAGRAFAAAGRHLAVAAQTEGLEAALGSILDRQLLARGIAELTHECRPMVLAALNGALQDAFMHRQRNASGDFSADPKAARFPAWDRPAEKTSTPPVRLGTETLTGLVEGWWREAETTGRKPSTHQSYRNTMAAFVSFLGHDDASRVTPQDVLAFKDHRLAAVHPKTGRRVSPKTVKDSDLAGLKTVFGWAVMNRKVASNPAAGITIKLAKPPSSGPRGSPTRKRGRSSGLPRDTLRAMRRPRPPPPSGGCHGFARTPGREWGRWPNYGGRTCGLRGSIG